MVHQFLSIASSFVSMAWSMASYQRLLRVALKTKLNISWTGTIVQFMWHFLVTGEYYAHTQFVKIVTIPYGKTPLGNSMEVFLIL